MSRRKLVLRALKRAVVSGVGLYLFVAALVWWFEEALFFQPGERPLEDCALPQGVALETFAGERGLFTPAGGAALAVFYHGNAGSACGWRLLGLNHLAPLGYDALVMEYPGFAGDDRKISLTNLSAMIDAVRERAAGYERVVLIGFSMGAGVAALHASRREADAVVLFAPFDNLYELAVERGYVFPRVLLRTDLDNARALRGEAGPVTIVVGTEDRLVPPRHARALARKLQDSGVDAAVVEIDGAGHNDLFASPRFDALISGALPTVAPR